MKKIIVFLGFCALVVFAISCTNKQPKDEHLFDAKLLKTTMDTTAVVKLMHEEPDTSFYRWYFGRRRFIQMYNNADSTEFRFKKDRLVEVIVHKPTMAYEPKSITRFGLPLQPITSRDSSAYFMWKNVYRGFDVVNFYLNGDVPRGGIPRYKVYFKLHEEARESAQN
ncbi:MAG TPA: hypothetical protein VKA27_16000 [Sunxiuqinia sp.]|nr:hypothetical protein [Sunxiuqinia sp.]